jgi:hypothetical protein
MLQLGWVEISRDDLQRAATQLRSHEQGVVDELGMLSLHLLYARRFFPGTSVLHTRLRYLLFVPRIIAGMRADRVAPGAFWTELEKREIKLAQQLDKGTANGEKGIIGGSKLGEPVAQPPSMSYWSALATYGLLARHPHRDRPPTRGEVRRSWRPPDRRPLTDDEGQPIDPSDDLFENLPRVEPGWLKNPLTFRLAPKERDFLTARLEGVLRFGPQGGCPERSLLAELVKKQVPVWECPRPWDPKVVAAASKDDRAALLRAKGAAALSGLGRAVYAAQVETLLTRDGAAPGDRHARRLAYAITHWRRDAERVDLRKITDDGREGDLGGVATGLRELQTWLRGGAKDPMKLRKTFAAMEYARKDARARLVDGPMGVQRRREWKPDRHPQADRVHFRWFVVQRFLHDLYGPT